jgi:hypothetical protein
LGDLQDEMVTKKSRLERALVDPSAVYPSPESVLDDETLSRNKKEKILRQWEFDMAELAVATEEGMPHDEEDLTRRIRLALKKVEPHREERPTGPGKHHVSGEA